MWSNRCRELRDVVDVLTACPVDQLSISELQQLTAQLSGVRTRLAGLQCAALGELTARSGGTVPSDLPSDVPSPDDSGTGPDASGDTVRSGPPVKVHHWLRDLDGRGANTAGRQVRTATLLRSLPLVLAAVRAGQLTLTHAAVLTRLVGPVDPSALADAEPNLIAVATGRDPQALAGYVNHLLATWCEPHFEHDQRNQHAKRYLQTTREPGGMLSGRFRLPAADSEAFLTLIEPLARPCGQADDRTAGQRRADALLEACQQVLAHGELGQAGGFRPQVSYVVPAHWAAGTSPVGSFADLIGHSLATHVLGDLRTQVPVEDSCAIGAWSGPTSRNRIEALLCDARLTRVLLSPTGQTTTLQALGDSITKAQRRALAARDHGCVVRGCTRPPAFCDAHHLDSRADDGPTTMDNLVLLCRRHHTAWHQGRLTLHQLHIPWHHNNTNRGDPPF